MSDALKRLIEEVEAGSIRSQFDTSFERAIYPQANAMSAVYLAGEAYCGSLDAAKAMHDALLPGWQTGLARQYDGGWCWQIEDDIGTAHSADAPVASRAWLLAILKAKLALLTPAAP